KEEEEIEHQEEKYRDAQRVLTDRQRARRDDTARGQRSLGEARFDVFRIDPQALDQRGRQARRNLFVNAIELDASLIQPLHERGRLGRDRGDQPRERQDHDRYDDEQARRGRKRAPRREALLEPRVERINDDPERDGPEHRLQEAADQPQEGDRYENQERREERAL